ncbi:ribbon-helix-helix domain-containing protein [Halobacterium sp. KA-6]|uniref:ribbon-helix-helix domain-containing protein n=1 Tax=Halobacterium sp. KA-6 TaxID=2896368 RepID=UPI001E411C55|nr:ribbon-helix-helix domain-containing protein [Halobacterium sp. KA-6]MCD2204385.1 ribbon-helix-helix domain-containing protein [Halobacterium sp. KA-6]
MAQPSLSMPDAMQTDIDDRRHSTTSRSEYIREAIALRFLLDDRDEHNLDALLEEARTDYLETTTAEA